MVAQGGGTVEKAGAGFGRSDGGMCATGWHGVALCSRAGRVGAGLWPCAYLSVCLPFFFFDYPPCLAYIAAMREPFPLQPRRNPCFPSVKPRQPLAFVS